MKYLNVYSDNFELIDELGPMACTYTGFLNQEAVDDVDFGISFDDMMKVYSFFKKTEVWFACVDFNKVEKAIDFARSEGFNGFMLGDYALMLKKE